MSQGGRECGGERGKRAVGRPVGCAWENRTIGTGRSHVAGVCMYAWCLMLQGGVHVPVAGLCGVAECSPSCLSLCVAPGLLLDHVLCSCCVLCEGTPWVELVRGHGHPSWRDALSCAYGAVCIVTS